MKRRKLLLTGVFGPYGVSDEYAEGTGMQMELLNNQITREQGIHSPRQAYWTFPLYLLAENIAVASTVLDFPTWRGFTRELTKGYTHVGINFIVPNVHKARRMALYIRRHHPDITIILGGYGTTIPDLAAMVPHDAACRGEGVRWLREYFGEDPDAPLRHPALVGPAYQAIYGYRGRPTGGILMPGVGCENGCAFCVTSHVYGKKYLPLLSTGAEIFKACLAAEKKLGTRGFTILDENFLKQPRRARELLDEMTRHGKAYVFDIFSSAEVIKQVGVDFLVRLGVRMVWVGVESRAASFEKTRGIDLAALFADLRDHGIVVNASAILFQDHHTEQTLRDDIDYVISLNSDLVQFMNYTPLPGTALHEILGRQGRLKNLDYRYVTGAGELAFEHPHITDRRAHAAYLRDAFRKKYRAHGPGVLSMAITALCGYRRALSDYRRRREGGLAWNPATLRYEPTAAPATDRFMELRIAMMGRIARNIRPILTPARVFAPNRTARRKARLAAASFRELLGPRTLREILSSLALVATGAIEYCRLSLRRLTGGESLIYQPPMKRVAYPQVITIRRGAAESQALHDLIPRFIRSAMTRRRLSPLAVARRASVPAHAVKAITAGDTKGITRQTIESVARVLGYRIVFEHESGVS